MEFLFVAEHVFDDRNDDSMMEIEVRAPQLATNQVAEELVLDFWNFWLMSFFVFFYIKNRICF